MKLRFAVAIAVAVLFAGVVTLAQDQGRTVQETWTGGWSGVFTSCPDGAGGTFDIWNDYTATFHRTTIYDKGGQLKQVKYTVRFTYDLFYNMADPSKHLMGGPGENEEARYVYEDGNLVFSSTGGPVVRVNVPGYGPVFIETGRWVGDPLSTTLFNSGHNDFHDLIDGDATAAEAFCNALK